MISSSDRKEMRGLDNKLEIKPFLQCVILAFLPTLSIESVLKVSEEQYTVSNSVLSIVIFVGIYVLWKNVLPVLNKRLLIVSTFLGSVFSVFMVCGKNVLLYDFTSVDKIMTWINIAMSAPLFVAVTAFLLDRSEMCNKACSFVCLEQSPLGRWNEKRWFWISWGLITLAWIPGLLASYPGMYGYDSVFQVEYYQTRVINLHHPLLHTYLLGFCVETLGELLGSREQGFFVYTVFQMLCVSGAFALICKYLSHKRVSVFLKLFLLAVFMFLPVNVIMAISSTKDILYSVAVLFLVICGFQIAEEPKVLYNRKFCIRLILVVFLNMALRNQGIYVFIFGMFVAVIVLRKQWKRLAAISLVCLLIYGVYSGPITKLLGGVSEGGVQELMSVPIVQLSRTMINHADKLTEEEKEAVKEFIPDYEYYPYSEGLSDPMKKTFNSALFKENPLEFVKLWVSVGLKAPLSYIDAFARITIGLWYPDMNYHDPQVYHPYWEYESTQQNEQGTWTIVERKTPQELQWLADFYYDLSYNNSYQRVPVVATLFSSGAVVWVLLIYIAKCIYRRIYSGLIPAAFLFGLWGTLLLGPVVLYRYVFPIFVSAPVLICSLITQGEKDEING